MTAVTDILLAALHDAELVATEIGTAGRTLSLRFKRADGTLCTLRFTGVRQLRINGMFRQNVASRVLLTPSKRFDAAYVQENLEWLYTFDNGRPDAAMVEAGAAGIANGTLILFYVDPSIGAEIAVLSAGVTIEEIPEEPS
jgi:hypothetical protein